MRVDLPTLGQPMMFTKPDLWPGDIFCKYSYMHGGAIGGGGKALNSKNSTKTLNTKALNTKTLNSKDPGILALRL